jgi:hypothetical protein
MRNSEGAIGVHELDEVGSMRIRVREGSEIIDD